MVVGAVAIAAAAPAGIAASAVVTMSAGIFSSGVVGGALGGFSNMMTGGSFLNGFCGGFINGSITAAGVALGNPFVGNFCGGFVGNMITENFNNMDESDNRKKQLQIFLNSMGMGLTQTGIAKIGAIGSSPSKAGIIKGSEGYWIARFFGNNLNFTSSTSSYTLIDGLSGILVDEIIERFMSGRSSNVIVCE